MLILLFICFSLFFSLLSFPCELREEEELEPTFSMSFFVSSYLLSLIYWRSLMNSIVISLRGYSAMGSFRHWLLNISLRN